MTSRLSRTWWNSRRLRLRLTLLYGGLFIVAGSLLLWITYLITAQALEQQFVGGISKIMSPPDVLPPGQAAAPPGPVGDVKFRASIVDRADSVLSQMVSHSMIVMILVGVIALVLGYVVADRALRPLDRVTETAQRLSESTLHERIALHGPPDEVRRLADTFDAMLDRLHRVFDAQRRFIANASHELRTPLAINRTVLEVSLEEPAASEDLKALARALLGTNARYERLIEGLLLLAQSEQELTVRRAVDVEQVVRMVLEQIDLQSRKRPVTLHQDLRPVLVEGDPLFLERCVFNLLENATKYNVRGGEIWLTLRREAGVR
ncbi:sensor histidine kinase [Nonomuraea basaltis]|uniref:sensor histidine kinase n=1 Tax=Nonomuraea basaltis TaxID=2495887 RepID=UPI00110C4D1E|nr:histidine kinase dimerization/phospho-acceptor domain-containing protein [Nonomuraea basaltis]TMR91589.1 HAMP domain-containing protein [Nonomuraea basaltis]